MSGRRWCFERKESTRLWRTIAKTSREELRELPLPHWFSSFWPFPHNPGHEIKGREPVAPQSEAPRSAFHGSTPSRARFGRLLGTVPWKISRFSDWTRSQSYADCLVFYFTYILANGTTLGLLLRIGKLKLSKTVKNFVAERFREKARFSSGRSRCDNGAAIAVFAPSN